MAALSSIKLRRGTAALWKSTNPVLAQGEPGYETDTGYTKIGDGTSTWTSLTYQKNPSLPINVKDYGAVGDGTTDDTAAIQAALTAFASVGGELLFPVGTYKVTSNLSVAPAVLGKIRATGAVLKVGATWPTGAVAVLTINGSNLTVSGLCVDGNGLADRLVTVTNNRANLLFENCEFRNTAQQASETDLNVVGLRIQGGCTNITVDSCYFHDITSGGNTSLAQFSRGILISDPNSVGTTTHVRIRGCMFENIKFSGISSDADAICIQDFTTNTWTIIDSCSFKNLHKRAVKIQSPGVTVSNCTIQNDYLGTSGVNVYPDPQVYAAISVYANDCVISNNNIIGGSWLNGIEIGNSASATASRVTVVGNRVIGGATAVMTGSGGIRVNGSNSQSELIISGNYVGRFSQGIWLSTAQSGIVISGNQVNAYNVASTSGVYIDGDSSVQPTRLAITGNSFEGTTRYGIETVVVPTDMTVSGNMGGRTGFEIISSTPWTSYAASSRRAYSAANGGGGSVTSGADGTYGSNLPQGGTMARVLRYIGTNTYGTTITPDGKTGDWQTITVTNSTAFTIAAPTNPPSSTQTQRMTIEIYNNSGGAMGTITWNAAFVFAGQTWVNPASTKRRYATFEFNGTSWVCTAVAAADY